MIRSALVTDQPETISGMGIPLLPRARRAPRRRAPSGRLRGPRCRPSAPRMLTLKSSIASGQVGSSIRARASRTTLAGAPPGPAIGALGRLQRGILAGRGIGSHYILVKTFTSRMGMIRAWRRGSSNATLRPASTGPPASFPGSCRQPKGSGAMTMRRRRRCYHPQLSCATEPH
jgi:hypothetical protein